jgi:hypothetical protein
MVKPFPPQVFYFRPMRGETRAAVSQGSPTRPDSVFHKRKLFLSGSDGPVQFRVKQLSQEFPVPRSGRDAEGLEIVSGE